MSRQSILISLLMGLGVNARGERKLAHELVERAGQNQTVDVIVQYRDTPDSRHHQRVRDRGGMHKTDLSLIKSGHYSVSGRSLAALENDQDVVSISPDRVVTGTMDVASKAINATIAPQTARR